MQNIKFRAWHKKEKKMCTVCLIETEDVMRHPQGAYLIGMLDMGLIPINELIIMQSIGLKDKNGKEIFEGDIVKWSSIIGFHQIIKREINTESLESEIYHHCGYKFMDNPDDCEVIGNIHENKELLK